MCSDTWHLPFQINTGIAISLRFAKTSAYKKIQVEMGDKIFKVFGAPSSWRLRESLETDDDEINYSPPTPSAGAVITSEKTKKARRSAPMSA